MNKAEGTALLKTEYNETPSMASTNKINVIPLTSREIAQFLLFSSKNA